MGESFSHARLVKEIIKWVEEYDPQAVIFADSCIIESREMPPRIGGHVPDVYARVNSLQQMIIGEAKTRKDIENDHSMSQFRSYLYFCRENPGTRLILAVPWEMRRFVHNLLNRMKDEIDVPMDSVEILHCFID